MGSAWPSVNRADQMPERGSGLLSHASRLSRLLDLSIPPIGEISARYRGFIWTLISQFGFEDAPHPGPTCSGQIGGMSEWAGTLFARTARSCRLIYPTMVAES